jgi:hypothetical protein
VLKSSAEATGAALVERLLPRLNHGYADTVGAQFEFSGFSL